MKVRIREGNDFDVVWAITRAGQPEDLSSAINMKLTLVVYGAAIEHNLFTVTDNVLSINIPKEVATIKGDYRLVFEYTLPDAGQPDGDLKCKTDVVPFRIVPFTADADDVYTVNTSSDVLLGFKGDKGDDGDDAYQIWLDLGNVGTYEDFIAYLRQPAVDAGASISELEGEIRVSEGLRVSAEAARVNAEATRLQSESERLAAEIIRQSNEGNRIENEDTRVQNEAERISKENVRLSSEVDRIEAEEVRDQAESERVVAETARVNAEGDATKGRVKAENKRVQAESERAQAETARANAEGDATKGRVKAENERVAAEGERAQAFAQMMGEADDKIEEMDTTLSTYEGRIAEVEGDISQLAGDVSLLDAVQGAKIKDIENVLSTANLGQSTQVSVSGRKVVSLPKNAANGGMRVKLEGLTAENLVVNGDFRNGLTGWTNLQSTIAIVDGKMVMTYLRSDGSLDKNKALNNSKHYLRIKYSNTDTPSVNAGLFYFPSVTYHLFGRQISDDYSAIIIPPLGTTSFKFLFYQPIGGKSTIERILLVDLKQTFGAGNEPTVEECDAMFSDYFEGVKSFVSTGRVRSVDKNGLNPTALYLTAPELRSNGTVKDEIRKGANGYELVKRVGVATLSAEKVVNGDFAVSTGWTISGTGWSISDGKARCNSAAVAYIRQNGGMTTGAWQKVKATVAHVRGTQTYITGNAGTNTNLSEGVNSFFVRHTGITPDAVFLGNNYEGTLDDVSIKELVPQDGAISNTSTFTELSDGTILYTLATPEIIPISYGGVLNSAENGTVYHEPIIADAGVYGTNMPILLTDYPIASIEEIIKHENGVDTYLNVATAVVAPDGLSFTHPDLTEGDLVLFTYAFDKESTNGNITATFYDSNVVKIDTATGKAYKIEDVVTNGVLTRTLTEV